MGIVNRNKRIFGGLFVMGGLTVCFCCTTNTDWGINLSLAGLFLALIAYLRLNIFYPVTFFELLAHAGLVLGVGLGMASAGIRLPGRWPDEMEWMGTMFAVIGLVGIWLIGVVIQALRRVFHKKSEKDQERGFEVILKK